MGSRPTSEYFLGAEAVCQRQSALSCVCVCVYQATIGPLVNTPHDAVYSHVEGLK